MTEYASDSEEEGERESEWHTKLTLNYESSVANR